MIYQNAHVLLLDLAELGALVFEHLVGKDDLSCCFEIAHRGPLQFVWGLASCKLQMSVLPTTTGIQWRSVLLFLLRSGFRRAVWDVYFVHPVTSVDLLIDKDTVKITLASHIFELVVFQAYFDLVLHLQAVLHNYIT